MTTQVDEALGAGVTYSTGLISMLLGGFTDAVPTIAAFLGLLLVMVRLVYEAIRLKRYILERKQKTE